MGAPNTQPTMIQFFLDNGSGKYNINELAMATDFTHQQIRSSLYRILQGEKLPGLTVLARGQIWTYDPTATGQAEQASTEPALAGVWFVSIGHTASGKTLVRPEGDEGASPIYVLTPLDI